MKLSIIIPAYNAEKWIVRCVRSALNSYNGELEVICVDDGSTDSTPKLIQGISQIDSRVQYIRQDNMGRCVARNSGIARASGECLTFLDADDQMVPGAMDYCVELMREDTSLICSIGKNEQEISQLYHPQEKKKQNSLPYVKAGSEDAIAFLLNCDYEREHSERLIPGRDILAAFNSLWCSTVFTKLFRTDVIKRRKIQFVPGLKFGEDTLFLFDYLCGQEKKTKLTPVATHIYNIFSAGTIRQYKSGDALILRNTIPEWHKRFPHSSHSKQISACCARNILFLSVRAAQFGSLRSCANELNLLLSDEATVEIMRSLEVRRLNFASSTVGIIWLGAATDLAKHNVSAYLIKIHILGFIQKIKDTIRNQN